MRISDGSADVGASDLGAIRRDPSHAEGAGPGAARGTRPGRGAGGNGRGLPRRQCGGRGGRRTATRAGWRTGEGNRLMVHKRDFSGSNRLLLLSAFAVVIGGLSTLGAWLLLAMGSEEHTSELQSLMRISYAVFCLKKKKNKCHKFDEYLP